MANHRAIAATLALVTLLARSVAAADYVVTRYDDPVPDGCFVADCSLREAVIAVHDAPGTGDRIVLSAGTYALTRAGSGENDSATGDLDISVDLEIVGVSAALTRIDAQGLGEEPITASNGTTFVLRRLSIQNSDEGGLTLLAGTYTIEQCEIRDNGSNSGHSGVSATGGADLTIRDSTIAGNLGFGVLVIQGHTVELVNVTLSGNGPTSLAADLSGNGVTLFSCTHCTITGPSDAQPEVLVSDGTIRFVNSIIVGSCSTGTDGNYASDGGNVESKGDTCELDEASDQVSVRAAGVSLGALADHGGGTRTHQPGSSSAAVGGANDFYCADTDQRGVARTTDCESGAVERTSSPVPTPIFIDGLEQGDPEAWSAAVG